MTGAPISSSTWFSSAARPTLLDAVCEPDLMFAIVLADLMSSAVHRMADTVREHCSGAALGEMLLALHKYVDGKLVHADPAKMDEIWGEVDLREEGDRLGSTVGYATELIRSTFDRRSQLGLLKPGHDILSALARGRFPEYEFGTLEILKSVEKRFRSARHPRAGMSGCADETVLLAALCELLVPGIIGSLVILGSPVHFTLFVMEGDGYWFNAKREFFDAAGWAAEVAAGGGDAAAVLESRFYAIDRIVTFGGCHIFHHNVATIPEAELGCIWTRLSAFFGFDPRSRAGVPDGPPTILPASSAPFPNANAFADGPDVARRTVQLMAETHRGSVYELALYTFRDLGVQHMGAYVRAAVRGPLVRTIAAEIGSVSDAVAAVGRVAGGESAFGDASRIAMPDETLVFGTGSRRDKALLLFALLSHAACRPDDLDVDLANGTVSAGGAGVEF